MPRTGCALGEFAMNINPATRKGRRATSTLMKQTSFLHHTLVSRRRWGWPMILQQWRLPTTYLSPIPPSPPVLVLLFLPSLFVAFINGKKSARHASMVLLVVEKARILSPPIRARYSEPSSRRVEKRRETA